MSELGLPLAEALGKPPGHAPAAEGDGVNMGQLVPYDLGEIVAQTHSATFGS